MPRPRPEDLVGTIYDTVLSPGSWPDALRHLASLFNCHFADVFARTEDRSTFHGEAVGLDTDDYQQQFLGIWTPRNVWRARRPVGFAGEVVTTQEMISRAELARSEMFNDYLDKRDLHQGLRLATWKGEGWVNAISLMRSWSQGEFTARELSAARIVMPHLQRSAAMARRLAPPGERTAPSIDGMGQPAILVDAAGRVHRLNGEADALAGTGDGLSIKGGVVCASAPNGTDVLLAAIKAAGTFPPRAATLQLARAAGRAPLGVSVLPVSPRLPWPVPDGGSVLILLPRQDAGLPSADRLRARYGLTPAELVVALRLRDGASPGAIADEMDRSVATVRSHLARLMQKTETNRQAELVRRLLDPP